jgi:hypothetical protein
MNDRFPNWNDNMENICLSLKGNGYVCFGREFSDMAIAPKSSSSQYEIAEIKVYIDGVSC